MKKRVLSIALALVLTLAFVPMAAADGDLPDLANFVVYREGRLEEFGPYEAGVTFTDIGDGQMPPLWYTEYVRDAFEYGIVGGVGDNRFAPTSNLNGFQLLVIAARIHSIYVYGSLDADDALESYEGDWAQQAVAYTVAHELVTEEFAEELAAKEAVTRADMALVWVNVLLPEDMPAINPGFMAGDVAEDAPYYEAVVVLYEAGIVTGNEINDFEPDSSLSRGQAATLFMRIVNPAIRRLIVPAVPVEPADFLAGEYFIDLTPAGMPMVNFLDIDDEGKFALYNHAGELRNTGVAAVAEDDTFTLIYDNREQTATFTVDDDGVLVFSTHLPFGAAMNLIISEADGVFVTAVPILPDRSNVPGNDPLGEVARVVAGTYVINLADYGMPMPMVFFLIITEDREFTVVRDDEVRNHGTWEPRMGGYTLVYESPESREGLRVNFTLVDGNLVFEGFVPLGSAGATPPEGVRVVAQLVEVHP